MAQHYISTENQTLLWKTIHRSPQFANNTISINREQWFSSIIKHFYEKLQSSEVGVRKNISIAELKLLNQDTITYMIKDLQRIESMYVLPATKTPGREASEIAVPGGTSREFQQGTSAGVRIYNREMEGLIGNSREPPSLGFETAQSRMSMYNDQFNMRQQEYTNMIKPPAPPIANFSEKIEDEAITNMDELLQQQIKQREYDIAQSRPPVDIPSVDTPPDGNRSIENKVAHSVSRPEYSLPPDVASIIQTLTQEVNELRDAVRNIAKSFKLRSPELDRIHGASHSEYFAKSIVDHHTDVKSYETSIDKVL